MNIRMRTGLFLAPALMCFLLNTANAALRLRTLPVKPVKSTIQPGFDNRHIQVKFIDNRDIGLDASRVPYDRRENLRGSSALQTALARITGVDATWRRLSSLPESRVDKLREKAENNLGRQIADLNNFFYLSVPDGIDATVWLDQLNDLAQVEIASPVPLPAPPPSAPGNFQNLQVYYDSAPDGLGLFENHTWPGATGWPTTGSRIRIVDFEYSWNQNHADLPSSTMLIPPGLTPVDPFNDNNHGTAVLGELAALNSGTGVTGGAYDAELYVAPVSFASVGWSLSSAMMNALDFTSAGDFWLIEQQTFGPNFTNGGTGGQEGLVPTEWILAVYNVILTAVGNGIHIMEASGNGREDLDAPEYNVGHAPFVAGNNSGAVIISAGGSPFQSDRIPLSFSNYGSRIDVQGWGNEIVTTGYGDLFASEGVNQLYTGVFGGSSGASPMVTSAGVMISGVFTEQTSGLLMDPLTLRDILIATGSPQLAGPVPLSHHIGPRPDANAALLSFGVRFTADTVFGRAPLTVNFASSTPETVTQWNWDLSDTTLTGVSATSITYDTGGSYDISVSIQTDSLTYSLNRPAYVNVYSDTMTAHDGLAVAGADATMIISARNFLPLTSVAIPFTWGGPLGLILDSASTVGLRTNFMTTQQFTSIDPFNKRATFVLRSIANPLPADSGAILVLHFSVPDGASGANPITIGVFNGDSPEFVTPFGAYEPVVFSAMIETGCCVTAGDANDDSNVNIADATFLIARIFAAGPAPLCDDQANANGDNSVNIADVTYLIARIFAGGLAPICGTSGQ